MTDWATQWVARKSHEKLYAKMQDDQRLRSFPADLAARVLPLVIGLTIVTFGTIAPELRMSLRGAYVSSADPVVGNVVGSNIFNMLSVVGVSAPFVPLVVPSQLAGWHTPVLIVDLQ